MALETQLAEIDYTQGVDKKTAERLVIPTKLRTADNVVFGTKTTLVKRSGHDKTSYQSNGYTGIRRLSPAGNDVLIEATKSTGGELRLRSNNSVAPTVSNFLRCGVDREDVQQPNFKVLELDSAEADGYRCIFQAEYGDQVTTTPQARYTLIDTTTNAVITSGTFTSTNGIHRPRVVTTGSGNFFLYYMLNDAPITFKVRTLNFSGTLGTETNIALAASPTQLVMDVFSLNSTTIFAATMTAVGTVRAVTLNSSNGATILNEQTAAPGGGIRELTVLSTNASATVRHHVCVSTANGGGETFVITFPSNLSAAASTSVNAHALDTGPTVGAWDGTSATILVATTIYGTGSDITTAYVSVVSFNVATAAVGTPYTTVWGALPATRPFYYKGQMHLGVFSGNDNTQNTILVVNAEVGTGAARPVARILPEEAGDYVSFYNRNRRLHACTVVSDIIRFCLRRQGIPVTFGATDKTKSNVSLISLNFSEPLRDVEFYGMTVLAGGCPRVFDGRSVFELGANSYPVITSATAIAGGSVTAGDYTVCAVYEITDFRGQTWRSKPSLPVQVTTAAANLTIQAVVRAYQTTELDQITAAGGRVRVVLYRSKKDTTAPFYQSYSAVTEYQTTPVNNTITVTSADADTNLAALLLYTDGGVVGNDPFPAFKYAVAYQDRLFFAGLEDPYAYQFTQPFVKDDLAGIETNSIFRRNVPPTLGKIKGLEVLDDKLVILCERGHWFIYGSGPDRRGLQDGYSEPQSAPCDTGAVSPWTARCPDGIFFSSVSGPRLLDRGLSLAQGEDGIYVGSEPGVLTVVGMVSVDEKTFVYTSDGTIQVWDFRARQWTRISNQSSWVFNVNALGCVTLAGGARWHGAPDNTGAYGWVWKSRATAWTDDTYQYNFTVLTGWIRLNTIAGFQRIRRVRVIAPYAGATTIVNSGGFDYVVVTSERMEVNIYSKTIESTAQQQVFSQGYALDSVGLDGTASGEFEIHCKNQKCEVVSIGISDSYLADVVTSTFVPTSSFPLISLVLELGLKKGAGKVPSTYRGD